MTLIDVIIFKGPTEAADPALWVHELQHVRQFRDWGVHSFAVQYMRSYNSVEEPAYALEAQYRSSPAPRVSSAGYQVYRIPPPSRKSMPRSGFEGYQARAPAGKPLMISARFCVVGAGEYDWCHLTAAQLTMTNCSCTDDRGQQYLGYSE